MYGLRFLLAGLGAVAAGLMISFNSDIGGPLRGVAVIVLGAAVSFFGIRMLVRPAPDGREPSPATEAPGDESNAV
jgi:hypothetical protein